LAQQLSNLAAEQVRQWLDSLQQMIELRDVQGVDAGANNEYL
jgi:hypothetical protein